MRTFMTVLTLSAMAAVGVVHVPAAAGPTTAESPSIISQLVVHEWGTFTSFSGSNGLPVSFRPENTDLPSFVYFSEDQLSKGGRLLRGGLVSMETPVLYFYTDRDTRVGVTVDFPRGWITEWYPFASSPPALDPRAEKTGGQRIHWEMKLTPAEPARFPREKGENHYYAARETDASPLQVDVPIQPNERQHLLRGGSVVQREKFLFYRGVGTFPPPVTVRALGGEQVQIRNSSGGKVGGLVLLRVHEGMIRYRELPAIDPGAEATARLPEKAARVSELKELLVKSLMGAGLYAREAHAMVNTWDSAWLQEEGMRLLYLVPRAKTDELLPLKVTPQPTEVVRVLVGRHDFLTPEQEAVAERNVRRADAARVELEKAENELRKLGRFAPEARQLAQQRLATSVSGQK